MKLPTIKRDSLWLHLLLKLVSKHILKQVKLIWKKRGNGNQYINIHKHTFEDEHNKFALRWLWKVVQCAMTDLARQTFSIVHPSIYPSVYSLRRLRLLCALPGMTVSRLTWRPAERLRHSRPPWKSHRQPVQNWKLQSARLQTPSILTGWHLAGCWQRGHGLRHSSMNRVLATWRDRRGGVGLPDSLLSFGFCRFELKP